MTLITRYISEIRTHSAASQYSLSVELTGIPAGVDDVDRRRVNAGVSNSQTYVLGTSQTCQCLLPDSTVPATASMPPGPFDIFKFEKFKLPKNRDDNEFRVPDVIIAFHTITTMLSLIQSPNETTNTQAVKKKNCFKRTTQRVEGARLSVNYYCQVLLPFSCSTNIV